MGEMPASNSVGVVTIDGLPSRLRTFPPMRTAFCSWFSALFSCFRSRASLQVENLAPRQQISVLRRGVGDDCVQALLIVGCGSGYRGYGEAALCAGDHQTGDGHRLASQRVPNVRCGGSRERGAISIAKPAWNERSVPKIRRDCSGNGVAANARVPQVSDEVRLARARA